MKWKSQLTSALFFAAVSSAFLAAPVLAQGPGPKAGHMAGRPNTPGHAGRGHHGMMHGQQGPGHAGMWAMRMEVMQALIPPRMALRAADELGLSAEQRKQLESLVTTMEKNREAHEEAVRKESESLKALLAAPRVDQAAALAQAERVMDIENQMKLSGLQTMIQAKNLMTPDQLAKAEALKKQWRERMKGQGEGSCEEGMDCPMSGSRQGRGRR